MKYFNQTLLGFLKKEFKQVLRDPKMRIVLIVAPMIEMTLFGFALTTEIKNVNLGVYSQGPDRTLQHIYDRSLGSGWFLSGGARHLDPFERIQAGEVDAVLIAPSSSLNTSLYRRDGEVQLLINASNVTKARSIEQYIRTVTGQVLVRDFHLSLPTPPLRLDFRVLYNPTMSSAVFQVPAVMGMLMCIITILFTAMSITKEKEDGTFETLISAPVHPMEIILGKSIPFIVLGVLNLPLVLSIAVFVFKVPMRGSFWLLLFASLAFVCVTVSLGIMISTIARTQQQSMMAGFLFLFPAILLSGAFFPINNMPLYMQFFARINPLTYYLELLRNILLKGGDPRVVTTHTLILLAMACVFLFTSFRRFRTTLG